MSATVEVTVEDLSLELVATKVAVAQLVGDLVGTAVPPEALDDWALESSMPVVDAARLDVRVNEIEARLARMLASSLLEIAGMAEALNTGAEPLARAVSPPRWNRR